MSRNGIGGLALPVLALLQIPAAQERTVTPPGSWFAPLPSAAEPFKQDASDEAWLAQKPGLVVTETEVGFDTRAVSIRQYLRSDSTKSLDSLVLWEAYYPELSDYLAEALLEKRRSLVFQELTKRAPKDTSSQPSRFELPVKVPDWAKKLGVDKPSLSLSGDYKFRIKSESHWTNIDEDNGTANKMPGFEPDQEPNINLVGTIGKLIHVQLSWTKDGFGVSNNQLLQIRYAGEKPEDTEDDILQEAEFGYINFAMPGTQLTGYTEQASGLIGLKARMRFGDLDLTVIGGGEKGEKQRQKLGASTSENTQTLDDRSPAQGAFFLDEGYRDEFDKSAGNYSAMTPVGTLHLFVRVSAGDVKNYPTWAPFFKGSAQAYDANGKAIGARTKTGETWVELPSTDFSVRGGVVFLGNSTLANSAYNTNNGALGAIYSRVGGAQKGTYSQSNLDLVLLSLPTDPVEIRKLTLRNRYRMPFTSVAASDRTSLKIKVLDQSSNKSDKSVNDAGVDWAKVFGLVDEAGQPKVGDRNIFDWDRMEISLPSSRPFAAVGRTELYDTSWSSLRTLPARFALQVTSKSRKSVFQVASSSNVSSSGCMDIIEGSEILTLNGSTRLTKDVDYSVVYNIGQITLLSQRALDPSSDISIDYQCTPFFSLETKTLMGGRLEYELPVGKPKESLLGATLLYRSETVTDTRAQLKREPNLSWLWGANLRLQSESEWLSDLAGYVPLVTPHGDSRWKLELEGAQTWNDPNTMGEALVDDFENSKVDNTLPLTRTSWYAASPPGGDTADGKDYDKAHNYQHKGTFVWHSNSQVAMADIYPSWDDGNATKARQNILQLKLQPNDPGMGYSWGGIMRPFSDKDLSKTRVIEVVVRGSGGVLNFDLGDVSEDVSVAGKSPNGALMGEDVDSTGTPTGRPLHDRGMDGLYDSAETGYRWVCPGVECGSPSIVTPAISADPAGKQFRPQTDANDPDPSINGTEGNNRYVDNGLGTWFDTKDLNRNGKLDLTNAFNRFSIHLGGDSATSYQELTNGWRMYRLRLEAPDKVVGGGAKWNNISMIRMWYSGLTSRNGANQQEERVQIARVGLVGNQWTETGHIARNDSITVVDSLNTQGSIHKTTVTVPDTNSVRVTVVSKQENTSVYRNWGVPNSTDASSGAVQNEQSLRMEYRGLRTFGQLDSAAGSATRSFSDPRDLTLYQRFQLMVYHHLTDVQVGSVSDSSELKRLQAKDAKSLRMVLRMGSGGVDDTTGEYYEYSWNLGTVSCAMGDAGCKDDTAARLQAMSNNWRDNRLDVPISVFTSLKDSGNTSLRRTRIYRAAVSRGNIPLDVPADYRQDSVAIKGNPSLSNIQWVRFLLRPDAQSTKPLERLSGEVWVNDLKLNQPQRGLGTAARGSFEFNLADLFSASASASLTEGSFVPMGQKRPSTSTAATVGSAGFDTRLALDKFLPEAWRVQMPIGYGIQTSISRPWMRPGSDRPLSHDGIAEVVSDLFKGELDRDSAEQVRNTSRAFQTLTLDRKISWNYRKEVTSDNTPKGILVNLLFERPKYSWIYRDHGAVQPERRDTSWQHDIEFDYDFTPMKLPGWKPFKQVPAWMPPLVSQLEFNALPSKIDAVVANIDFQEGYRYTLDPDNDTLIGAVDWQRKATLSHSLSSEWTPINFLRLNHKISSSRSFDKHESHSFDPAAAFPGILDLTFATDTTVTDPASGRTQEFGFLKGEQLRSQGFGIDVSPQFAAWLTSTGAFSSSSSFARQSPLVMSVDTATHDTTRITYWRGDERDGFRSQLRVNVSSLLGTVADLGSGDFTRNLQGAKKKLEAWKFSGLGMEYSVDNTTSGNQTSLAYLQNRGLDAWGLQRYSLGLGDEVGFRSPWDLVTGSRSRSGLGQYEPGRLDDTAWLNASRLNMRNAGADFSSLSNQRSYRVSSSTDFTVPRLDLTIRPSLTYSTSWDERWNDPVNVDTTTTWPQIAVSGDWANLVPKIDFLGKWFQSVTVNHSVGWDITDVVHPHSSTSDREDVNWKFTPLIGTSFKTKNGLWTFDNKFNYTTTLSTNYGKEQDAAAPAGIPPQSVLANPVYWYHRKGSTQDSSRSMGDDFTATYRIQTKKGIQILKWFFKLESDLVISFNASWSNQIKVHLVDDGTGAQTQTQLTQDLTIVKVGSETSYSFTPKLTATARAYYTRQDQKTQSTTENPTVTNDIQMLLELAYRF